MVASGSMEQTMYKGDIVLVNKTTCGARLSQKMDDVPLLNVFGRWFNIPEETLEMRMPAFGRIKREDIVVFNHPYRKEKLVKRCTGIPGDTFMVAHNIRYVNGNEQEEPEMARYSYKVWVDNGIIPVDSLKYYGVNTYGFLWQEGSEVHYTMSQSEVTKLRQCSIIQKIELDDYPKGAVGPPLFLSPKYRFTRENFGPIVVPKKGMNILLKSLDIELYRDVIVNHERNSLNIEDNRVFINGIEVDNYTFKQDYYFMMGDNRYQSVYSRYWGFVPETHIIGTVVCYW